MLADDNRRASEVRVLVVEDFEPFQRFICSILGKKTGLRIVGQASDGLEAVRKAGELQPDLILLDIGLPTLNGIAAARQIRTVSPLSRTLFVSQESDSDVVQEAINQGAFGYVVKTRTGIDLPAAVDAVLEGKQFLSDGWSAQDFTTQSQTASGG